MFFKSCLLVKVTLAKKMSSSFVFGLFFTFRSYAGGYRSRFEKSCLCMFFFTDYQYEVKRTS